MKPREPRRKVLIRARMCIGGAWSDVCILNISSRGMLLQSASPPPRGDYLELRRGSHIVVARVAWAKQHRFGIRSQDVLAVDSIIAEPDSSAARPAPATTQTERRAEARRASRHDDSRIAARAFEFACMGCIAALGATALYGAAQQALAQPLGAVSSALGD